MQIPPQTPADIDVFIEVDKLIFRVGNARSIYVYDRDKKGASTCADKCLQEWSPVIAATASQPVADWTLIKRNNDGAQQWRYRNRPIYTYRKDKPGTTFGDGVDGAWHLVTP